MLYREIIAVCSEMHRKRINTLCGQNVELLNVKLVVYIATTGLYRANYSLIVVPCLLRHYLQHLYSYHSKCHLQFFGRWTETLRYYNVTPCCLVDSYRWTSYMHPIVPEHGIRRFVRTVRMYLTWHQSAPCFNIFSQDVPGYHRASRFDRYN